MQTLLSIFGISKILELCHVECVRAESHGMLHVHNFVFKYLSIFLYSDSINVSGFKYEIPNNTLSDLGSVFFLIHCIAQVDAQKGLLLLNVRFFFVSLNTMESGMVTGVYWQ